MTTPITSSILKERYEKNLKTKTSQLPLTITIGICFVLLIVFISQIKRRYTHSAINPHDFSTTITNKYFTLPVGTKFIYEAHTSEGLERNEIVITGETKIVNGVTTLVYSDKVWLNGQLAEVTRDYLAQHKNGDIWYFGEEVDNYVKGKLVNHGGSWLAGTNGAQPGFWVKENPRMGESYRQEYFPQEAEDMADVIALNKTVTTPYGTFTDCLQTRDWTPLDPASLEYKYYCPEVHMLVVEHDIPTGEEAQLIDIQNVK